MWGILLLSLALSRGVVGQQIRPCSPGRLPHVMQSDPVEAGPQHTCCNTLLGHTCRHLAQLQQGVGSLLEGSDWLTWMLARWIMSRHSSTGCTVPRANQSWWLHGCFCSNQ